MTPRKQVQKTIQKVWARRNENNVAYGDLYRSRLMEYRRTPTAVVRVEKPYNLSRARALGYKAKPGIVVVRVSIRRGGGLFIRPKRGRKPKRMGINKMTRRQSIPVMAENRAAKRYPNMEVLNSYKVGEDGRKKYFEVILVEPSNPSIIADKDLNWIVEPQHKNRVTRGKTSAGRKNRGLNNPSGARGTEKIRPSIRANKRRGK